MKLVISKSGSDSVTILRCIGICSNLFLISIGPVLVVIMCCPNMEIFNTVPAHSSLFSHPSLCKTHLILSIGHFQRGLKSGREGERMEGKEGET